LKKIKKKIKYSIVVTALIFYIKPWW